MSLKKRLILILVVSGLFLAALYHFSVNPAIVPDLKQQKKTFIDNLKIKLQTFLIAEEKNITALCSRWAQGLLIPGRFIGQTMLGKISLHFTGIMYNDNYKDGACFIIKRPVKELEK